jgi:hypothetical protein
MSAQLRVLAALFTPAFGVCHAQTVVPASVPELRYPPLARAARVQGDVVVSFKRTPEGRTVDVAAISGRPLLAITVENVNSWRFEETTEFAGQANKVIFALGSIRLTMDTTMVR